MNGRGGSNFGLLQNFGRVLIEVKFLYCWLVCIFWHYNDKEMKIF